MEKSNIIVVVITGRMKHADVRHGQKASLEGKLQITIHVRYEIIDGEQLGPVGGGGLDLHLAHQ